MLPVCAPEPCTELVCTVDIGDGDDRLVQAPRFSDAILTSVRQKSSRILLSADAPVIWKQTKFVGGRPTGIYVSLTENGSPQSLRHSDNNGVALVAKRPAAAFGLYATYPTLKIRLDTGVDRMTDV